MSADRAAVGMTPVARAKLESLEADGYMVNGVALMHRETHKRAFLDCMGYVGWHIAEADARPVRKAGEVLVVDIPRSESLDPITLFLQNYGSGAGRVVIACYDRSWLASWGAMGTDVVEFIANIDPGYLEAVMVRGIGRRQSKLEEAYALRVATAVVEKMREIHRG